MKREPPRVAFFATTKVIYRNSRSWVFEPARGHDDWPGLGLIRMGCHSFISLPQNVPVRSVFLPPPSSDSSADRRASTANCLPHTARSTDWPAQRPLHPVGPSLLLHDNGHPLMNGLHQHIRRRRDQADRAQNCPIRRAPRLPEPRERQRLARCATEVIRLLGPSFRFPFIKSIRRHQTPPFPERLPERRFLGDRLPPGIGQPVADRRILRPVRHQTPAQQMENPLPFR